MRWESGNPSNTPVPRAVPCSRCSLRQAGPAGPRNLPPATTFTGNQPSPWRSERPGLGMWARSRPGRGRGSAAAWGGVPETPSPFQLPSARATQRGLLAAKKGCSAAPLAPPAAISPSPSPLLLICWTPAIGPLKVAWEGGRGRLGEPSGLCCSLPLSQAL